MTDLLMAVLPTPDPFGRPEPRTRAAIGILISRLTLDCLRTDCAPNESQKPLPVHKCSDNSGVGMISENRRMIC